MALDLFAIVTWLSECEGALSKASYTISTFYSNLSSDIDEEGETLSYWISTGVMKIKSPTVKEI